MGRRSKKAIAARENRHSVKEKLVEITENVLEGAKRAVNAATPRRKKQRVTSTQEKVIPNDASSDVEFVEQDPEDEDFDFFKTPPAIASSSTHPLATNYETLTGSQQRRFGVFSAHVPVSATPTRRFTLNRSFLPEWMQTSSQTHQELSPDPPSPSRSIKSISESLYAYGPGAASHASLLSLTEGREGDDFAVKQVDLPDRLLGSDDELPYTTLHPDAGSILSVSSKSSSLGRHELDELDEDGFVADLGDTNLADNPPPPPPPTTASLDSPTQNCTPAQAEQLPSKKVRKRNLWRIKKAELAEAEKGVGANAPGRLRQAPSTGDAAAALEEIHSMLRGKRRGKHGEYVAPQIDSFTRQRLEGIRVFLCVYSDGDSPLHEQWVNASKLAAKTINRGKYCARTLRVMARHFIHDRTVLPFNPYGDWNETLLVNEDLCQELNLHIQQIHTKNQGISAAQVQKWLTRPDIMEKHGITKQISLSTATRYLRVMGFRFTKSPSGQYVDGHERADVVHERQRVYIPKLSELRKGMKVYDRDGKDITESIEATLRSGKRVVIWYHDESIFYAHDRRKTGWFHKDATAKPKKKGEGLSLMIADFVSADFGWLIGPTSGRTARVILKPGKNREGYFTNEDIIKQADAAMDILPEFGPDIEHVFVYDNATTHKKRADDALSARRMPKTAPTAYKSGPRAGTMRANFLVERTRRNPATNKPIHDADGNIEKEKVRMTGATFADGTTQDLYSADGQFKGMEQILIERGHDEAKVKKLKTQCSEFKCKPNATDCCCRRLLFNEPDFAGVRSLLEDACFERGVTVVFLPKFHCELNPIEQCWGYAKRLYRLCPESSLEADLVTNAIASIDAIPLLCIRRFCNRALRYGDAYEKGLNGREAVYASKRYRGHRCIPNDYMADFEKDGVLESFKKLREL